MIRRSVWKKFIFWAAGSAAVFLIILLLSLRFLIPEIISSTSVREKIKTVISQEISGTVDYQMMEVSFFPRPQVVIRHANFSLPGKAEVSADSAAIAPRILPLFAGKVRIARIQLYAPDVSLIISEEKKKGKPPLSIDDIKKKLSVILNSLASNAYGARIYLEKGNLRISGPDSPFFSFQGLNGQIALPPDEVSVALACSSNISRSITFDIRLNPADFKGLGTLRLAGMKPQLIVQRLFPESAGHLGDSEGDVTLSFRISGLNDIRADVQSSFHHLTILNRSKKIPLEGIGVSGGLGLAEDKYQITVNELKIEDPRITLSGSLMFDKRARNVSLALTGSRMDLWSLRSAALAAAGQAAIVRDIFEYVRGGEVPSITVSSRGATFEDLGATENILITSGIRGGDIFIPGPKLDFREVNADCVISRGVLDARNVAAKLGNTEVVDGKVRVGLKGEEVPLHVDAAVKADLAETRNILMRVIKDEEFIREVDLVRKIEGKASGRIIMGENTASLKPRVYLSALSFTAEYQRLPFPIAIKGGRFFYDDEHVSTKELDGVLGRSSFKELAVELRPGDIPHLEMSGNLRMELDEFFPWLKSLEGLKEPLGSVRSARGVMNLDVLNLRGPLLKPGDWRFKLTGSMEDFVLDGAFLPGPAFLERGKIKADEERLSLTDARTAILDASLTLSGVHQGYAGDRQVTDLDVQGEMGPRFLGWTAKLAGLPSQLSLRDPIVFEHAHVMIGEGTALFEGKWRIRKGPEISASVFKHPKGLAINNLKINDASSDAALSIDLEEKTVKLAFAGRLSPETLRKLIAGKEFQGGNIAGDFRAEIRMEKPLLFDSRGKLRAENISLSLKEGVPLTIENLSINSDGSRLAIESASIILDGNAFSLHGSLESNPKASIIDMDLAAGRIEWEKIAETAGKIKKGEDKETWDLPVEGSIRLESSSFSYGKYALKPLSASIALRRDAVDVAVTRSSLCGISILGELGVTPGSLSMDFQLGAENLKLAPALACFEVADRETLTGTFDLKVDVKGRGEKEDMLGSLRGDIEFSARDGRIYNEISLVKIFDFLKAGQILRGFPEMRREGLAYKYIKVNGELNAGLLDVKEAVVDGPSLKIAAQGSLDLKKEKIDFGVLVCPLKSSDFIIGKIPIVGGILGGNLVSIPVKVTGDLHAPNVSFNPVSAVGSGLFGIVKRTITAPMQLFDPFPQDTEKK